MTYQNIAEKAERWEQSLPRGVTMTVQQIFTAGYAEGIKVKNDILEKLIDSVNGLKADLEREREANAKLREALRDELKGHWQDCECWKCKAMLAAKQDGVTK